MCKSAGQALDELKYKQNPYLHLLLAAENVGGLLYFSRWYSTVAYPDFGRSLFGLYAMGSMKGACLVGRT